MHSSAIAKGPSSECDDFQSIELFEIPWSSSLPHLLGESRFRFDGMQVDPSRMRWLGLVSSHRSKLDYANEGWQFALQSAFRLAIQQGWGILFAADTPFAGVISHAARRLQLPCIALEVADAAGKNSSSFSTDGVSRLQLASHLLEDRRKAPLHDQGVVFLSNYVFAIDVRAGGRIESLLKERLQHSQIAVGTTYVVCDAVPHGGMSVGQSLLRDGAVGWLVHRSTEGYPVDMTRPGYLEKRQCEKCQAWFSTSYAATWQPVLPLQRLLNVDRYLVHCTRARRGPWPEQSLEQFHDELFGQGWLHPPHPIETLNRILMQQRLFASRLGRQGSHETVCFSETPIQQLLSMRRFQSHLSRWDWEPYGIMIDREWLRSIGAKPVTYVDRNQVKGMTPEEISYVQIVSHRSNSQDWTKEKEWRLPGDLRLNAIPFSKAVVFVSNRSEASLLAGSSRWPVAFVHE